MEKINFNYSVKNIPIPPERDYKMQLIEKIEMDVKRMRWKAIFYNNENEDAKDPERYGLKSFKTPPAIRELNAFENDLFDLAKNIEFRRVNSEFQKNLAKDIKDIKQSEKTLTSADKTSNMYKLTKEEYNKMLKNAITSTYKKTNNNIKTKINSEGKRIIKKCNGGILNKMEVNSESNCFITIKDHKDNFENNPTVRLINPAKNEVGRISKCILDRINKNLRNVLNINQWKNTTDVIKWFESIPEKNKHKFLIFDIKDFYPSIKQEQFMNAIKFAKQHTKITKNEFDIINHARKSLLYNGDETWMKKSSNLFDVTMGAFDGAEVCELVGTFLLNKISQKYNKNNIGLYRDDGLAVFKNKSGPESEKIKKELQKIFKENGLDIVIQCNIKIVNYLDVSLNLNDGTYRPYHKPDNQISYVHIDSNHPSNIIKQIPLAIESRLSELSSNENIFKESVPYYDQALQKSGYQHNFTYKTNNKNNQPRNNRKRKIIWFNPPFSKNVKTKIAKLFLDLITKHFPRHHKFHKIFNRNNVKVSYSCMPNIKSKINSHNHKILKNNTQQEENIKKCNCINKNQCPLNQQCLSTNIVYQANINSNLNNYKEKYYIGLCETTFKLRYANHKKSFNHEKYKNNTELSKEYWKIKSENGTPKITWKIIQQSSTYNQAQKRCALCLNEKTEITYFKGDNLINKKNEIISSCRHQNKYKLANFDTKD